MQLVDAADRLPGFSAAICGSGAPTLPPASKGALQLSPTDRADTSRLHHHCPLSTPAVQRHQLGPAAELHLAHPGRGHRPLCPAATAATAAAAVVHTISALVDAAAAAAAAGVGHAAQHAPDSVLRKRVRAEHRPRRAARADSGFLARSRVRAARAVRNRCKKRRVGLHRVHKLKFAERPVRQPCRGRVRAQSQTGRRTPCESLE